MKKSTDKNRIIFHFNKASLADKNIPMWVIKWKGITYYVDHVSSQIGFETKETPDNEHTKGSIQFKGYLQIIEENNVKTAYITSEG